MSANAIVAGTGPEKSRQILKKAPASASGGFREGTRRRTAAGGPAAAGTIDIQNVTAFRKKAAAAPYKTGQKWYKLLKRFFTEMRFPQMFVKNTVDGMEKTSYDGNSI